MNDCNVYRRLCKYPGRNNESDYFDIYVYTYIQCISIYRHRSSIYIERIEKNISKTKKKEYIHC